MHDGFALVSGPLTVYHFLVRGDIDAINAAGDVMVEYIKKIEAGCMVTDFTFEYDDVTAAENGHEARGERALSITATCEIHLFADSASADEDARDLQAEFARRAGNSLVLLAKYEQYTTIW